MPLPLPEYESFDAVGLAERVRSGELSASEILDAAVARVAERNPTLNAIVIDMEKEARAAIDAGLPDGPLRGVPFLLKDLHLLYAGVRSTNGCRLFADQVADHDSELVARYKRAWALDHSSGGSSGGASSAVAGGIVPAANASDGGGSIRIPASCCGLFGLKPTRGRTPFGPDAGEGWSGMSSIHAVTRSVRDSAALLDATHGADLGAPYRAPEPTRPFLEEVGADPGKLRIAIQRSSWNGAGMHADCSAAIDDAAKLLMELGHTLEDAPFDADFASLGPATGTIMGANLRAAVDDRLALLDCALGEDDLEPITRSIYDGAAKRSAEDYARAVRRIHGAGRSVDAHLERYDLILSSTMATPPLPLGAISLSNPDLAAYSRDIVATVGFTQLFNASGHPAASVPLYWNDAELPIGIQLARGVGLGKGRRRLNATPSAASSPEGSPLPEESALAQPRPCH